MRIERQYAMYLLKEVNQHSKHLHTFNYRTLRRLVQINKEIVSANRIHSILLSKECEKIAVQLNDHFNSKNAKWN